MINQLKSFALAAFLAASAFAQFSTAVRDIDNAGRNAFSVRILRFTAADANANCPTPTPIVPAGYPFAVTQISIFTTAPAAFTLNHNYGVSTPLATSRAFPATCSMANRTVRGTHNVFFFFIISETTFAHLLRQVAVSGEPDFVAGNVYLRGYLVKL